MPEINLGGGNTLKPATMNLKVGDRQSFVITGPHTTSTWKGEVLYSIPVRTVDGTKSGAFPLNVTNRRTLAEKLGTNTDTYRGTRFEAIVVPQRNTETGATTRSWNVVSESINSQGQFPVANGGGASSSPPSPTS